MNLSRELLVELSKKSISNAKALVEEAEWLFEKERWPRTVFLCQTAGEEFGKAVQCISATVDLRRGVLNWNKFWSRFLTRERTMTGVFESLVLSDPNPLYSYQGQHDKVHILFRGKDSTLYATPVSDGRICEPADLFTQAIAEGSLKWARGELDLAERLIMPVLHTLCTKVTDEEMKRVHDELIAVIRDPKMRRQSR